MLNTVSKIRGQVKNPGYPQSEGLLGECMVRHGKELGGESNFGESGREMPGPSLGLEPGASGVVKCPHSLASYILAVLLMLCGAGTRTLGPCSWFQGPGVAVRRRVSTCCDPLSVCPSQATPCWTRVRP